MAKSLPSVVFLQLSAEFDSKSYAEFNALSPRGFVFLLWKIWRGILDKNVIGSHHKVHCIEFACILSYRTRYAVMSYSVMLYCNRNTVLSYSVTLHRNQNSIVSYSDADVPYPVVIYRNLYAVVSYSVTRYRNLNGMVSYPMLLYPTRCYYIVA